MSIYRANASVAVCLAGTLAVTSVSPRIAATGAVRGRPVDLLVAAAMRQGDPIGIECEVASCGGTSESSREASHYNESTSAKIARFVSIHPEYTWRKLEGVIVVRRVESWSDEFDPLNRPTGNIEWSGVDFTEAADRAAAMLSTRAREAKDHNAVRTEGSVDITVGTGAVIDVLNAVARKCKAGWLVTIDRSNHEVKGVAFLDSTGHKIERWFSR